MRKVFLHIAVAFICLILIGLLPYLKPTAASVRTPARLGIDVDFYTGPISRAVWLRMKRSGIQFVVAQAWGGRSRNEFAASQLADARAIGKMKEAAYVLLNYDDRVCPSFARPVRDSNGGCVGELIPQQNPGARWQIRQGLAALGPELSRLTFVAVDVEWFSKTGPASDETAQMGRRQHILDAIDEIRKARKKPVIYTRNAQHHWVDITGCDLKSGLPDCQALYEVINDSVRPVPLWDVQTGTPELDNFRPYGAWASRSGRQYRLDGNLFGLPSRRTVDLNVFDPSLFALK